MGFLLWIIPAVAALLLLLARGRKVHHAISVTASVLLAAACAWATSEVMTAGSLSYREMGGLFYIDSLSIIVLDIVAAIALLSSIYSVGYLEAEVRHGKISEGKLRFYYVLFHLFVFTMMLALSVRNMGVLWIAIEATTLASAFLVGFYNDRNAVEAAWKYIIICSVGIAIAMLGILFLHLSSADALDPQSYLDFTELLEKAKDLKSPTVRLAFIFILVGFGTKAGLAPMHTWLPDAHSQSPSPISALLSGVLLNSAMYGIVRTVSIVNKNLGSPQFAGRLLIALGLLSVSAAAVFILTQKDYKRLLAYSSIEHMGIIAIAIGLFTPLSVFGALYHMMNHSLTKSMLFLTSGSILHKYDTKLIYRVKGVLKLLPVSGTVFLLGLFAIAGTPPFSVFSSEFGILSSIFTEHRIFLGVALSVLLALVFAGIAQNLFRMFFGNPDPGMKHGEANLPGVAATLVLLAVITLTGLFIPDSMRDLLYAARDLVMGEAAR